MEKQAETVPNGGWVPQGDGTYKPPYHVYGKELLNSALYGAGLTAGGAALYHLFNGLQSAKVPELLRDVAPAAAAPAAKPKAKKKKPAIKAAEVKSATGLIDTVLGGVGKVIPTEPVPGLGDLPARSGVTSVNTWHAGWRNAANIAAALAGGYGGLKAVNALADKKKKEDLENEVDSARKEYFAALQGKSAEALDAAFEEFEKAGSGWGFSPEAFTGGGSAPIPTTRPDGTPTTPHADSTFNRAKADLWTTALLTALGTGTIGATYMYNQTKARSKAENLQRAQAARARLRGLQQTPWVDPAQLAALAKNK